MSDLVSVIIPTYKRPGMLGRAIESVLDQDAIDVEVVVVDDNNEGDPYRLETIEYMRKYVDDSRVKYVKHRINQNGSAARNTGVLHAVGNYISFLDDDDYFLKGRLHTAVKYLKSLPLEYGGVCSNYVKKYKDKIYKISDISGSFNSCFELLSAKVDFAAGSTLLIRREVLDKVGLFDTSFQRHQDWEFLIRYFRYYKLGVSQPVHICISADGIRNNPRTELLLSMKQKLMGTYSLDIEKLGKEERSQISQAQWKEIVCSYLKERKYSKALSFGKENVKCSSFRFGEIFNVLFSFIVGIYPKIILLLYFLLDLKNRKEGKI